MDQRGYGWMARRRLGALYGRLTATPGGRLAAKAVVAVLGGAVVLTGLVLGPLPGPGWVIVFAGVAIWAVEFHWARRLLAVGHRYLGRSGRAIRVVPLPVRVLVVAVAVVAVGLLMWASWRYARDLACSIPTIGPSVTLGWGRGRDPMCEIRSASCRVEHRRGD